MEKRYGLRGVGGEVGTIPNLAYILFLHVTPDRAAIKRHDAPRIGFPGAFSSGNVHHTPEQRGCNSKDLESEIFGGQTVNPGGFDD
jgi:hypothetical protein